MTIGWIMWWFGRVCIVVMGLPWEWDTPAAICTIMKDYAISWYDMMNITYPIMYSADASTASASLWKNKEPMIFMKPGNQRSHHS